MYKYPYSSRTKVNLSDLIHEGLSEGHWQLKENEAYFGCSYGMDGRTGPPYHVIACVFQSY
ncbi:hypothetical protein OESDEN_18252 [Oesophagostomum dentatum]|uniref:Uncharacterized protein n=1 Tax=Oesophagostomum dentatum TaxID=61180 RepID=A0A0B1SEV8_OESDE|nr:hypothetical protein OESDEN_18252 [Oesophagostomum dentatum]